MAKTDIMKKNAALRALDYIQPGMIVGVGTGSTANYFIEALSSIKHTIDGTVASSIETANRLKAYNIPVFELNTVSNVHVYIDGADEFNAYRSLIKGGGGALTREKIIKWIKRICKVAKIINSGVFGICCPFSCRNKI